MVINKKVLNGRGIYENPVLKMISVEQISCLCESADGVIEPLYGINDFEW